MFFIWKMGRAGDTISHIIWFSDTAVPEERNPAGEDIPPCMSDRRKNNIPPLKKKKKKKKGKPLTLKIALSLLPPGQIHIITFPYSGVIINVPPERGFVIPSELPINFLDSSDEAVNLSWRARCSECEISFHFQQVNQGQINLDMFNFLSQHGSLCSHGCGCFFFQEHFLSSLLMLGKSFGLHQ